MGVTFDKLNLQRTGRAYLQANSVSGQERAAGTNTSAATRTGKNFDEIMIRAHGKSEEQDFIKSVVSRISVEVRKTASEERLNELKGQIASGTYRIDAGAIAGRILLDGGGLFS